MFIQIFLLPIVNAITDEEKRWQRHSILMLTGALDGDAIFAHPESYLRRYSVLSENDPFDDECLWTGFTCENGYLTVFNKENIHMNREWHPQWFPKSSERIKAFRVVMKSELPTRGLPPSLTMCDMRRCDLTGSLVLQTLPEKLVRLDVSYNFFEGTIYLARLPLTLRMLILQCNRIERAVTISVHDGLQFLIANQNPYGKVKFVQLKWLDDR